MSKCVRCRGTGTIKRKTLDPVKYGLGHEDPFTYKLVPCTSCKGTRKIKTKNVKT